MHTTYKELVMKKYNRSLDLYALAAHAYSKGRRDLAAKLSIHAFRSPDVKTAIAVVRASNEYATGGNPERARVQASSPRVSAKRRQLSADTNIDITEHVVDEEMEELEALVGNLDSEDIDEDVEIDEEIDLFEDANEEESDEEIFSKVMAAFARKKQAPARRRR